MAAINTVELDSAVIPHPPLGQHIHINHERGFKYRGTLFRPSSASTKTDNLSDGPTPRNTPVTQPQYSMTGVSNVPESTSDISSTHKENSKPLPVFRPRQIQSAKGRLERNTKYSLNNSSSQSLSCFNTVAGHGLEVEKGPSVVNLNAVVDVPDKEEEVLAQRIQLLIKNENDLNNKHSMRPSSAKAAIDCPSAAHDTKSDSENITGAIKPSIYGLKLGRQVFGSEPDVIEAWANTEKDFPFKLQEENCEADKQIANVTTDARKMPSTLEPLRQWLRHHTSECVTGIDTRECLVFLSRDYDDDELPEVQCPQTADEDLPYSCIVVTPRQQIKTRYEHPFFNKDVAADVNWECSHTKAFNPETHGDISFLLNPPKLRNPNEIRKEIKELEDLLQGIGCLESNCSFVQFQAEIDIARNLAKKLRVCREGTDDQAPTDTFGLLKLYREHDEIMKVIHETRKRLLAELALLEQNSSN